MIYFKLFNKLQSTTFLVTTVIIYSLHMTKKTYNGGFNFQPLDIRKIYMRSSLNLNPPDLTSHCLKEPIFIYIYFFTRKN